MKDAPDQSRTEGRQAGSLTQELIVTTAVALADEDGAERLSMRRIAGALGVQAMSLYHHIAGKEPLLDAMVDHVYAEIMLPYAGAGWKEQMRERTASAREVLLRHPWAVALMSSREQPGPATLAHHEAVLACLRAGGFSVELAAHAFSLIDSYVFGFVLQEGTLPFETAEEAAAVGSAIAEGMGADHPHMTEMLTQHVFRPDYSYASEFGYGLELLLDALERELSGGGTGREA